MNETEYLEALIKSLKTLTAEVNTLRREKEEINRALEEEK